MRVAEITVRGEPRLGLYLVNKSGLMELIQRLPDVRWSKAHRCWHVADTRPLRDLLDGKATICGDKPPPECGNTCPIISLVESTQQATEKWLLRYESELVRRHYAPATVKSYVCAFRLFLQTSHPIIPAEMTSKDIAEFVDGLARERHITTFYQNQVINAVSFFYDYVACKPPVGPKLIRPQRPRTVPHTCGTDDITQMISTVQNVKHLSIILLAYGLGLRVSEILLLKLTDVSFRDKTIRIAGSRRCRPRHLTIPNPLLHVLRDYRKKYQPVEWVFEGRTPGEPYSARTLQLVVRQAAAKAGLGTVTARSLRHSFAAHLLEHGTYLSSLQGAMGHGNIRSTGNYLRVVSHTVAGSPLEFISKG